MFSAVCCLCVQGKSIATCSEDRSAALLDFDTTQFQGLLCRLQSEVWDAVYTPDGSQIAVSGE